MTVKQALKQVKSIKETSSSIDLTRENWLSKNIRPLVLIYLLVAYTLMTYSSAIGFEIDGAYVELLGQWGMLVMTAYFGGRTVEKVFSIREKNKS